MISTIRGGERLGVAADTSKKALPLVPNPRSLRMFRRVALLAAFAVAITSCANSDTGTAPEVTTGTLVVQNSTSTTIAVLFFSECSADVWGSDRLGGNPIGAGSNRSWTLTAGCYDIKAVGSDLRVFQKNAITVPKGGGYTLTLTNGL